MPRQWICLLLCTAALLTLRAESLQIYTANKSAMVPLAYLAEWLGATVRKGAAPNTLCITEKATTVTITLHAATAVINGKHVSLAAPPEVKNGVTYVPIRLITTAFGVSFVSTTRFDVMNETPLKCLLFTGPNKSFLCLPQSREYTEGHITTTPLHLDIFNNRPGLLEKHLTSTPINTRDSDGYTPLHYAALWGDAAAAALLLDRGANIELRYVSEGMTHAGITALNIAISSKHEDVALLLLRRKATYDYLTLRNAADKGLVNVATYLLDAGLSPNPTAKEMQDWPALFYAAEQGSAEMVELLLRRGAVIDPKSELAGRILFSALRNGNVKTVEALAKQGVSLTALLQSPYDPLSVVSWNSYQITFRSPRMTPLHFAAFQGKLELAQYLLEHGAEVMKRTPEGLTPLHIAAFGLAPRDGVGARLLSMLLAAGAEVNAVSGSYVQTIRREDRESKKHYAVSMTALTPLHLAMFDPSRRLEKVKALVEKGANVNARTKDGGMSVLHLAVIGNDGPELYEYLLEHGADVNAKAADGRTPLKLALDTDAFVHVVNVLREHGGK